MVVWEDGRDDGKAAERYLQSGAVHGGQGANGRVAAQDAMNS